MAKDKDKDKKQGQEQAAPNPEGAKSRVCALCGEPALPNKGILVGRKHPETKVFEPQGVVCSKACAAEWMLWVDEKPEKDL